MTKRPISEDDAAQIRTAQNKTKSMALKAGTTLIGLGLLLLIMGAESGRDPFEHEFSLGSMGVLIGGAGAVALLFGLMKAGGDAPLEGEVWVSESRIKTMYRDDEGQFMLLIDKDMPLFRLDDDTYRQLSKGDLVLLEYHAPSQTILRLDMIKPAERKDGIARDAVEW